METNKRCFNFWYFIFCDSTSNGLFFFSVFIRFYCNLFSFTEKTLTNGKVKNRNFFFCNRENPLKRKERKNVTRQVSHEEKDYFRPRSCFIFLSTEKIVRNLLLMSSSFTFEPIFVISQLPCVLSFANVVLTSTLTDDEKKMFWQFERETYRKNKTDWQFRLGLIRSSSFTFQPRKKNLDKHFLLLFKKRKKKTRSIFSPLHKHKSAQIVYLSIFCTWSAFFIPSMCIRDFLLQKVDSQPDDDNFCNFSF